MIATIMEEWHERWRDHFGTRAHSAGMDAGSQLRDTSERCK
jgi:hypothetical protein